MFNLKGAAVSMMVLFSNEKTETAVCLALLMREERVGGVEARV